VRRTAAWPHTLRPRDGPRELALAHARPALDAQAAGAFVQIHLAVAQVRHVAAVAARRRVPSSGRGPPERARPGRPPRRSPLSPTLARATDVPPSARGAFAARRRWWRVVPANDGDRLTTGVRRASHRAPRADGCRSAA